MSFGWFKSRAEKEMERKMAIRSTMNELKRCKISMEKKKDEMLRLAVRAKQSGLAREYVTAKNAMMTIMKYSQTLEAIWLRLQIAETMRDMSRASMKAVKSMGAIGKELSDIMNKTNFLKNQAAFEMGSMRMEEMMSQMESMLDSTSDLGGSYQTETSDTDWSDAADRLIEASMTATPTPIDQEIEELLKQMRQQGSSQK